MEFEIRIYNRSWKLLNLSYHSFDDRKQAELKAERDMDWIGASHWEVRRIG